MIIFGCIMMAVILLPSHALSSVVVLFLIGLQDLEIVEVPAVVILKLSLSPCKVLNVFEQICR